MRPSRRIVYEGFEEVTVQFPILLADTMWKLDKGNSGQTNKKAI
jgi:hypothetical protein